MTVSKKQLDYIKGFKRDHYTQVIIYFFKRSDLLKKLDAYCKANKVSRSEFVRNAVSKVLGL